MLTLSRADVEALGLTIPACTEALEVAFLAVGEGRLTARPKSTISLADGSFFIGAVACWPERGIGLFHNIMGTAAANVPPGAPHYTSRQLVSDYHTATPLALIDGSVTSTILPAAITALTAPRLARPDSRIATFVGAGVQARVNLEALAPLFPIAEVRVLSRTERSAASFAAHARDRGYAARVLTNAREAVAGADLIVTSVPGGPGSAPFLDPAWVSPGAYVSAVDLGRSWHPGFESFERIVTDDRAQAVLQNAEGRMPYKGNFDTEIPELVAGTRPGRSGPAERIAVIHPGNAVGVMGLTALILEASRRRSAG